MTRTRSFGSARLGFRKHSFPPTEERICVMRLSSLQHDILSGQISISSTSDTTACRAFRHTTVDRKRERAPRDVGASAVYGPVTASFQEEKTKHLKIIQNR